MLGSNFASILRARWDSTRRVQRSNLNQWWRFETRRARTLESRNKRTCAVDNDRSGRSDSKRSTRTASNQPKMRFEFDSASMLCDEESSIDWQLTTKNNIQ